MGRTHRRRRRRQATESPTVDSDKKKSNSLPHLYVQLLARNWQNSTQLSAHSYAHTGRGLCSKRRSFVAGDELIRLPVHCLISIATLEADEAFKGLFNKDLFDKDARISFQALIACYLMHEQHFHDCSQTSDIGVYLDTLPSSYTTPYFCTIPELQCLPESLLERTVAQNRQIRDYYEILKTLVGSQCCECCGQRYFQDIWTLSEYRVAYFAVNTRSVYLNARMLELQSSKSHFQSLLSGSTNLALAPLLDLFNHSDAVQTTAEIQGEDFVLTLNGMPTAEIKPYEQLYISYGALTNLKLLTEYGFWLKGNAHDYFELSLLDIEHMIKHNKTLATQTYHRNIFKFIREHNLSDQMFVHLDDGCSHNLRVVLHLIFKQQAYFPNVLNQIAFGDVQQFDDVQPELAYLVAHKISEYRLFAGELDKLPQLTESGAVARSYLTECIQYLNEFEAVHCACI